MTLEEVIVRANFALAVIALGVFVTWGLYGVSNWRKPGSGLIALVAAGWLGQAVNAEFWGTSRFGRWTGVDWSRWMTDSAFVLGLLLVFVAIGMLHIVKATHAGYGWRPAAMWATAAAAAAVWPEHIVGAIRALTGI